MGNWLISILRFPVALSYISISIRDIIIPLMVLLVYPILNLKDVLGSVTYLLLIIFYFFGIIFVIVSGLPMKIFLLQSRIILAIPFICLIYSFLCEFDFSKISKIIEKLFLIFIFICVIEAFFLITFNYSFYLDLIGYNAYMLKKGVIAGYFGGLFSFRLITPFFNSSVGGAFLAVLVYVYFKNKTWYLSIIAFFLLVLTFSKTGLLLLILMITPKKFSLIVYAVIAVVLLVFALINDSLVERIFVIDDVLKLHLSSIKYHLEGFRSGLYHFFSPLGIGQAGTIMDNLKSTNVGRESALGLIMGTMGYFTISLYLPVFLKFIFSYKESIARILFIYMILAIINEATGPLYFWIILMFTNFYAKENSYNYI